VVATFYNGMPPEQIEGDITSRFERFFTLGSGIDHIESRSLPGVSLIKIYFQPGTSADADLAMISNLAMANLRRLPPGTLPPVVIKFDASSLPVCLVTLKGPGMTEAQLRDTGQFAIRNQIANVPGASVPTPFGGKYRQIMVYVDPIKLEARALSVMDVVRAVNDANLILPAGDVKIGPIDYNIYTNSQLSSVEEINQLPLKSVADQPVYVADVGQAKDANLIQTNIVRVDGQPSVYLPIMRQGGDTNTIAVVDGIKGALANLVDIPKQVETRVVFDQSAFVKQAIETLLHEGGLGLLLTALMILIFLGSMRATVAVLFSIPLSALATFIALQISGSSINSMVLGGLALAFSRLIDNSVIVLENIFRHLELGESPEVAAEKGGQEVALAVLAATLATVVVFFPVTFLYGVSKFLFTALALAVVLAMFASYFVAMTVVPLFCAKFMKSQSEHGGGRFQRWFHRGFDHLLGGYHHALGFALARPLAVVLGLSGVFLLSLALYPRIGLAFFPRTDAGQFVVNLKAASGTRLEITEQQVKAVEDLARKVIPPDDFGMVVSNIGNTPDFSAIYNPNSGEHTAFIQVSLKDGHKTGTYEYMNRLRARLESEQPDVSAFFQAGGLVDAVLNMGMPAPIDVQVSGPRIHDDYRVARKLAALIRNLKGVSQVYTPQDLDYPALRLDIDRLRASELGLNQKEVVDNIITALTSNTMIAPSFWIDPKTGLDYMLTVQYPEGEVKNFMDLASIPLRASGSLRPTTLDVVSKITRIETPTEVDHFQLARVIDVYASTTSEDLGRVATEIDKVVKDTAIPAGVRVNLRGMVGGMRASFRSFGTGLLLAVVLVYLILVAQFKSFLDPFLILLAVPTGLTGVLITLDLTGTTLNVMSLMGIVMMVGMVTSNGILIVQFIRQLREDGVPVREAVGQACRIRLRPILMTSLATIIGLLPMALKLGAGSESYAPLAMAIIGGLSVSVVLTVFIVPAAYLLFYGKRSSPQPEA